MNFLTRMWKQLCCNANTGRIFRSKSGQECISHFCNSAFECTAFYLSKSNLKKVLAVWERLLPIVFWQKSIEVIKQLMNTINLGRRVISILTPWADQLSISAHKSQRQFAKELASDLAFLQSLTPRQHCSQLLYLSHCSGVKATKSLHSKRQEDDTLAAASFSCVPDLSLVGLRENMKTFICVVIVVMEK